MITVKEFLSEMEDKLAQEAIDLREWDIDATHKKNTEELKAIARCWDILRIKRNYLDYMYDKLEEIE